MKTVALLILTGLLFTSCSGTYDNVDKTDDKEGGLRLGFEAHFKYPTLKSTLTERAVSEFKTTGNSSKLNTVTEMSRPHIIDSLYMNIYQEHKSEEQLDKSVIEAYHSQVESFKSDYERSIARSGLSRKILLNFKVVESGDLKLVAFFANELIESQMGEYQLILRCLEKLNGNVPADQFEQMKVNLHRQIEVSRVDEVGLSREFKAAISEKEKQVAANPQIKQGRAMLASMKKIDFGQRLKVLNDCGERLSKL